jgi:hypothetical protein
MVNPATGKPTPFEELWRDEEESDGRSVLFVRNAGGTMWQARVGNWQLALGRESDGVFWAWQAERIEDGEWVMRYSTKDVPGARLGWLPPERDIVEWCEGTEIEWKEEQWLVLEKGQ